MHVGVEVFELEWFNVHAFRHSISEILFLMQICCFLSNGSSSDENFDRCLGPMRCIGLARAHLRFSCSINLHSEQ